MTLAEGAIREGYNVLIVNPIGPATGYDSEEGLEVMDFSNNTYISQSIEMIKTQFGADSEIVAVGFSLGSNHLLRHLGSHYNCGKTCGIKAAVSISGCFDIHKTGTKL